VADAAADMVAPMPADPPSSTPRAADAYRKRRDDAVAVAEQVSTRVPHVERLDGCTFCYTEEELVQLGGDPSSESDDLVRRFAEEGVDHWDEAQYRSAWQRLAGRILRLLDCGQAVDIGLLLRGLGQSCNDIASWPELERESVLDVLRTTLDLWLVDGRSPDAVIELLGALAHVYDSVEPWFARIDAATDPAIDAGVVRLAVYWAVDLLWGETSSWWWYGADPEVLARDWLCSQAVRSRLAAFAARNPRCKNAADALAAIRSLSTDGHGLWLRSPLLRGKQGLMVESGIGTV
jgi:hypothetical protein